MRSKEEADQTRLDKQVSRGKLGCLRLYYESFEKHGYFSNCGTLELIFFFGKETTLSISVRGCMCITAIEESLCCAANITFLPQKTADILNYAHHASPSSRSRSEIHPM